MFFHHTYLVFLLGWALPVIALHWAAGARILYAHRRLLLVATILPTVYLTVADGIAIRLGIWSLHPGRVLGISIGDVPLEEALFFLLTDLMVVQIVTLVVATARMAVPIYPARQAGPDRGRRWRGPLVRWLKGMSRFRQSCDQQGARPLLLRLRSRRGYAVDKREK